jgi:hypothetical protein
MGGKGGGGGKGGEMTQTLYAHMNKIKIKKKSLCPPLQLIESRKVFFFFYLLIPLIILFGKFLLHI